MSEYCYQCLSCGEFKEDCKCPKFEDPMAPYRDMSLRELMQEIEGGGMKQKELGIQHAIMQFCLCISCICLPLWLVSDVILSQNIFSQVLAIIILGIGGISIYTILGSIFQDYYRKMINKIEELTQKVKDGK